MNNDNYDKNIRAKFATYAPSVDESALWADIEAALPAEKKEKNYLFLILLFGMLGSALFFGFFKEDILAKEAVTNLSMKSIESSMLEVVNSPKVSNSSIAVEEKVESINEQSTANQSTSIVSGKSNFKTVQSNSRDNRAFKNTGLLEDKWNSEAHTSFLYGHNKLVFPATNSDQKLTTQKLTELLSPLALLLVRDKNGLALPEREILLDGDFVEAAETTTENSQPRWALDLSMAGGQAFSRYSALLPNGIELIDLRASTGQDLEALSAGVGLRYKLSNRWSVGLGLTYLRQVTSSEVSSTSIATLTQMDTVAVYNTQVGTQVVDGPREFVETTRQTHLRYQRTQQLLLPLSVQYNNRINDRWGYELGLGYGLSLWSDYRGIVQDPLEEVYDLSIDAEDRLVSRGSDRLILESHITRELADVGQLKFGIGYLHDLNGRYQNDFLIQKKGHTLQLSGGLIIPLKF